MYKYVGMHTDNSELNFQWSKNLGKKNNKENSSRDKAYFIIPKVEKSQGF